MVFSPNALGFTLVEISIVMIIIGLLIGGTFGGMKLIENMQVNRTVQDLKSIESAALTFKDTFGRLPGDIANPTVRLPNCAAAPCATGGNGNRSIGGINVHTVAQTNTDERFTFWHHLQASDLISMDYSNSTDMNFGTGQPNCPADGGYRLMGQIIGAWWAQQKINHLILITPHQSSALTGTSADNVMSCLKIRSIDTKIDDDRPTIGRFVNANCVASGAWANPNADWATTTALAYPAYFLSF